MASRTPGLYVPLDVNYARDPRIRMAGPDAELLYIRGLVYSKSSALDGLIPAYDLPVVGIGLRNLTKRVDALVKYELWEALDGAWIIRNWDKWNMSQAEIATRKLARQEAALRTNHERWHGDKPDPNCKYCLGESWA